MRFACEHCGKRYVVKDELLPGRTYRSKCKVCGHIIVVKGEESAADELQFVPASDPAPAAAPPRAGTPTPAPTAPSRPSIPAPGAAPRAVIPIPAPAPVAAPSRPSIPAPSTPAPAAPSRPSIPPPVFTQPPAPAAVATLASATAAMPPASAQPTPAPASRPAREDSGYIDLFDGKGFDDLAPLESPAEDSVLRESTVIPAPPPRRPIAAPVVAPLPEIIPPSSAIVRTPAIEAQTVKPRRLAPLVLGAVAVVLVGALGAVAVLRPWRSEPGPEAARSTLPTDKPTAPVKPPPSEATAAAVPPAKAEPPAEPAAEPAKAEPAKAEPAAAEPAKVAAAEPARPAEAPAKAAAEEGKKVAKIQEGLSTAAIRKVLRSSKRAFDRCVANPSRGLAKPLEARRVSLRLSVEPSGSVSGLAIDDAAVAKAPVGQCLKTAGMNVVFPAFHGAPILVDAPVELPAPAPAATNAPPPAPPEKEKATQPSGPPMVAVEFSGVSRTVSGGEVGDTRYSQKPDDTSITDRQYNEGVLTYSGQVGMGNGSAYGGIGFYVNVRPGGQPIDASRFKSVTLRLSSPTSRALRVRLQGPEQSVASAGCYPMVILGVSEKMKTFKIALDDFSPDLGCGGRGRYPEDTLPQLVGFEVVDISVQNKPTSFSVGSITLNP